MVRYGQINGKAENAAGLRERGAACGDGLQWYDLVRLGTTWWHFELSMAWHRLEAADLRSKDC